MRKNEVSFEKLKKVCDPDKFTFENTSTLKPLSGIIGQERATSALEFGLNIKTKGYNIYMSGETGTGKTSYAQNYIKKVAKREKTPDDWCYVYNFEEKNEPKALSLPAGMGKIFQGDIDRLINSIEQDIRSLFGTKDSEQKRADIIKKYQVKRKRLIGVLNNIANKYNFRVKTINNGIYFFPVVQDKVLDEKEFSELEEPIKQEISERLEQLQIETIDIMKDIKDIESNAEDAVIEWQNGEVLSVIKIYFNELRKKYREHSRVLEYLDKLQEDVVINFENFLEEDEEDEQTKLLLPFLKKNEQDPMEKYKVNILVDNSGLKGKPVIVDFNPTFYNLVGAFQYDNEFGSMVTDFTKIKAGLLHKANGGYLILQAKDVLGNAQTWEVLKRILRTQRITIEQMKEQMGVVPGPALKPEAIPLNIKVILIGSEYIYQYLHEYDEEFRKLFKIRSDFEEDMERNKENISKLSQFIASFCNKENVVHFHKTGVAKVVEYSSRLVEEQEKMSTKFNEIVEILAESGAWAQMEKSEFVMDRHVEKAISEKKYRADKNDRRVLEAMQDGTVLIDVKKKVIGQINGLSVLDMGDYSFGKPSRITATTFIGQSGIVNIEREIELSGTSHSKGILILSGYIGEKFAQDMPLTLTASLCFEQMYGGIDGDSASSAELYTILSSLAEVPINQGIAVTGSVNQKGEIQPIGGVNFKIEGFFELCKKRGLTGEQGVIIPHQNVKNLVLNDEVIEAVKFGKFHIYSIKTIDEGIEILTGLKAGKKNKNGEYPQGTVNKLVFEKLKKYAIMSSKYCGKVLREDF